MYFMNVNWTSEHTPLQCQWSFKPNLSTLVYLMTVRNFQAMPSSIKNATAVNQFSNAPLNKFFVQNGTLEIYFQKFYNINWISVLRTCVYVLYHYVGWFFLITDNLMIITCDKLNLSRRIITNVNTNVM
jgi:hypothetical protein